jgi:predicted nucleic acid-binding protein
VIVVDASAVLDVLLGIGAAEAIAARIFSDHQTLHAPHLLDLEVTQALRRLAAAGTVTPARAGEALDDLADLPVDRYAHQFFLERIWQLRHTLTAYAAAYIALAEALGAPVVTRDAGFAQRGHRAAVEVF